MRAIVKPRCAGKTYDMIQLSAILNVPILTVDHSRAMFIESMARRLKILIPKPIFIDTLRTINRDHYERRIPRDVVIDDADEVLRRMFFELGVNPLAMAITQNDYE